MSSRHVTFDTLTVGLGEDAGASDALSMTPPPVLARTPRVKGIRRFDPSGAAPAATPAEVGTFQVTADAEIGVGPAILPVDRNLRVHRPTMPDEPAPTRKPTPAPIPTPIGVAEPVSDDWATALLRWQSGSAVSSRLLMAFLLAVIAGASLILLRPASEAPASNETPEWTPAPLAEAAPLFAPEPVYEFVSESRTSIANRQSETPRAAPVTVAVGPAGLARQRAQQSERAVATTDQTGSQPAVAKVAVLPTPYPNPDAAETNPPAISQGPAAHLIGVRPVDSTSSTKLR